MVGKKIVITASILLIITLSGCEKYLEYEGEDAQPRLVLNGVFASDSIFSVELSNSLGYVTKGSLNSIPYGNVSVYNTSNELVDTLLHVGNGIYKGTAMAQANTVYEIRASAGDFGPIYASDIAPIAVPIASWDTTTVSVTEYDYVYSKQQVTFTVNDPAGIENFYIIEVYRTEIFYIEYTYDPSTGTETKDTIYYDEPNSYLSGFSTSDAILLSDADIALDETLYYTGSLGFNDGLFDGNTQSFKILIDLYYGNQPGAFLELRLTSCSEAYYKYKRTLENYYNTEGDPFAQPVQVFTNIENGGLGIWAGSSSSSVLIGD